MKVRVGSVYTFSPVLLDTVDPPYGVGIGILKPGDAVKVGNLPGAPKANTMGHCYVFTLAGEFAGLVSTNSLLKRFKRRGGE